MAEIMGALNSQEALAIFEPLSPDDMEACQLETKAVHRAIFGKNRGYVTLETAIRDAMLQRIGIIQVDGAEIRSSYTRWRRRISAGQVTSPGRG